jgi:hypothetical protein
MKQATDSARRRVRPPLLFAGSMIYLALIAAACPIIDASDMALGSMQPRDADGVPVGYDGALSTGEPRDVMTRLQCFGFCETGRTPARAYRSK